MNGRCSTLCERRTVRESFLVAQRMSMLFSDVCQRILYKPTYDGDSSSIFVFFFSMIIAAETEHVGLPLLSSQR